MTALSIESAAPAEEFLRFLDDADAALEHEARAVARGVTIAVTDGKLIRETSDGSRYTFRVEGPLGMAAVGPVTVRCGELRSRGSLDSIDGDTITITTRLHLGKRPGPTEISGDLAFLVSQIQSRMSAVRRLVEGDPESPLARRLRQALGFETIEIPEPPARRDIVDDLNFEQTAALRAALERSVSFVQGPSGTGKTTVIGATVAACARRGESVLVVAPTNVAVDHALEAVLRRVAPEDVGGSCSILRVGPPVELSEESERRIGARSLAEDGLPESSRPSPLRAHRERAIESVEALMKWAGAPELDGPAHDSLVQAVRRATRELASANAESNVLPGEFAARSGPGSTASRRFFEEPIRELGERALHDRQLAAAFGAVLALRSVVLSTDATLGVLGDRLDEQESDLIGQARVVGTTLAKALVSAAISGRRFDVVVLDEASMASLPYVISAAAAANSRFVIVGDPRQLAPIAATMDRDAKKFLEIDAFEKSKLVEALDSHRDDARLIRLTRQYRMHTDIARPASRLSYGGDLRTDRSVLRRRAQPLPFLAAGSRRVAVIDTGPLAPQAVKAFGTHSRLNVTHAAVSAAAVAHLVATGYEPHDIAVITPHAAHARLVQAVVRDLGYDRVLVGTVHRVQGAQRRAVVLDLADAPPHKVSQLLRPTIHNPADRVRRLLNVAVTRAEETLLVVADWAFLKNGCPRGTPLARLFREQGFRGPFTIAADLIRNATTAVTVSLVPADFDVSRPTRPWLIVNRCDIVGLRRVLQRFDHGARIAYRAEGAAGRANQVALSSVLKEVTHDFTAVGVDALAADMLIDAESVTGYGSPPWCSELSVERGVAIHSTAVVEELTRALRLMDLAALDGGGLLGCRGCGSPLTLVFRGEVVSRKCRCRITLGNEVRAGVQVHALA